MKKYWNHDIIKWLAKNSTMLYFAITVMLLQSFHTSIVLEDVSAIGWSVARWFQAVMLALVLEFFIIVYVIRNNRKISKLFAVFSVFVNWYYYYMVHQFDIKFFVGCAFGLVIPVAVYYCSEEIVKKS